MILLLLLLLKDRYERVLEVLEPGALVRLEYLGSRDLGSIERHYRIPARANLVEAVL